MGRRVRQRVVVVGHLDEGEQGGRGMANLKGIGWYRVR